MKYFSVFCLYITIVATFACDRAKSDLKGGTVADGRGPGFVNDQNQEAKDRDFTNQQEEETPDESIVSPKNIVGSYLACTGSYATVDTSDLDVQCSAFKADHTPAASKGTWSSFLNAPSLDESVTTIDAEAGVFVIQSVDRNTMSNTIKKIEIVFKGEIENVSSDIRGPGSKLISISKETSSPMPPEVERPVLAPLTGSCGAEGYALDQACWFLAASNQTCAAACQVKGLTYNAASYRAQIPQPEALSTSACIALFDKLNIPHSNIATLLNSNSPGCALEPDGSIFAARSTSAFNGNFAQPDAKPVCPCN